MKKLLTLIAFLLVAAIGMAQGSGSPKNDKDLDALIADAIKRGMSQNVTYYIYNSKNKPVDVTTATNYLRAKGYTVISSSSKKIVRFGTEMVVLDNLEFLDPNNFNLYAFNLLRGDNNTHIQYDQLKRGKYFFGSHYEVYKGIQIYKELPINVALWSGVIINGLLNGHGVGFIIGSNGYTLFEGDFIYGIPVGGVQKSISKGDLKIKTYNMESVGKEYVAGLAGITSKRMELSNELQYAIREYAKLYYNDDARQIEQDYNCLLTLNTNIHYEYQCNLTDTFINLYGSLDIDTRNAVPKAMEIRDVQMVMAAMAISERSYIYESILWGISIDLSRAKEDTTMINSARRLVYRKLNNEPNNPLIKYYQSIIDELEAKADRIYGNINRSIREYNRLRGEQIQFGKEMCEKCRIDGGKSTLPSGYQPENDSWFWGHPARSDEEGKVVLVCGHTCTWRYIFSGEHSGKIEAKLWTGYTKYYNTKEEMMSDIVEICKSTWCH